MEARARNNYIILGGLLVIVWLIFLQWRGVKLVEELGNQYIVRNWRYDVVEDRVVVYDPGSGRVVTMDRRFEIIFAAADGQRTVNELIGQIGSEYPDGAPEGLLDEICGIVKEMASDGLIRLMGTAVELPYDLSMAVSEQEKAEDGKQRTEGGNDE